MAYLFNECTGYSRTYQTIQNNPLEMKIWVDQMQDFIPRLRSAIAEFLTLANVSTLATADWLTARIFEVTPVLKTPTELDVRSPGFTATLKPAIDALNALLKLVTDSGRKDLWQSTELQSEPPKSVGTSI